jgi:hypothetical protein
LNWQKTSSFNLDLLWLIDHPNWASTQPNQTTCKPRNRHGPPDSLKKTNTSLPPQPLPSLRQICLRSGRDAASHSDNLLWELLATN